MGQPMNLEGPAGLRSLVHEAGPPLEGLERRSRSPTSTWSPWQRARPRVVAIHFESDGSCGPVTDYQNPKFLAAHFQDYTPSTTEPKRSVYILEALSPEFTSVLASHFELHPALFKDHERLVAFHDRATGERGGIPFLPSAVHGRDYVSLKYHEPLLLSTLPTEFRNLCDVSGRHIAATKLMGKFCEVGVARRKCTFWSRKTEAGGWDCLIVCDPPIKRVLTNYSGQTGYNVRTSPYNAGYLDFMPQSDQMKSDAVPPRTSLFNDIVVYLQTHSCALNLDDPNSARLFVDKIIGSHYLKLSEFIQTVIEKVQFNLSRRQDLTGFAIAAVEEQWSDVQALIRRISEYKDDLEAIMLQLRIPFEQPNLNKTVDWKDSAVDFQFLYMRFKEIAQRANSLNGSTSALAGLTNNRQAARAQGLALKATERSIREAKSVKGLTILGVVFIPLAYAASLFSMSDPFRPGGKLFWVYFVVAFPLMGLLLLGYSALELEYTGARMQWSLRTAVTTVKGKLERGEKEDRWS